MPSNTCISPDDGPTPSKTNPKSRHELSSATPTTSSPHPLGSLIQTIKINEITDKNTSPNDAPPKIEGLKFVTSYNWINGSTASSKSDPTILIPGKPPLYTPQTAPLQLQEQDTGFYIKDKCAFLYPKHPMEPAVLAVLRTAGAQMFSVANDDDDNNNDNNDDDNNKRAKSLDVMSDNKTLHNLLVLTVPVPSWRKDEVGRVRFVAEKVGKTVFLLKSTSEGVGEKPSSSTGTIGGGGGGGAGADDGSGEKLAGYGQGFANATMRWEQDYSSGVGGTSVTHQRVIEYRFGGLKLGVRFEGDGYVLPRSEAAAGHGASLDKATDKTQTGENKDNGDGDGDGDAVGRSADQAVKVDHVTDALAKTKISEPENQELLVRSAVPEKKLNVVLEGGKEAVPQDQIVDLKTRKAPRAPKGGGRPKDYVYDQLPRLWITQVPTVIMAIHTKGLFKPETTFVVNVKKRVAGWEKKNGEMLKKYAALLRWICETVSKSEKRRVEIVYSGPEEGVFEVREVMDGVEGVLSEDVRRQLLGSVNGEEGREVKEEALRAKQDVLDGELDFAGCDERRCGFCGKCEY